MSNFFKDRSQITRIESYYTEPVIIKDGTPQGSGLSGTCFDIHINDLAYLLKLFAILFADDTTLSERNSSVDKLIADFKIKFEPTLDWCKNNRLFINWSKTKAMFLHNKKSIILPERISFGSEHVEVVHSFKLLGVMIDEKLNFNDFIKTTKKSVNVKLYSFKKLYYLSKNVKSHLFKAFIQPHFDYCAALTVYLNKTQVNSIEKFHKVVLFRLLNVKLFGLNYLLQSPILEPYKLLPYRMRLCTRISIFCHKVINKTILSDFSNSLVFKTNCCGLGDCSVNCSRQKEIVSVPDIRTNSGRKSFRYFLPKLINHIILDKYKLNIKDFRIFLSNNLLNLCETFINNFF